MLQGSMPFLHIQQTPLVLTSVKVQNDHQHLQHTIIKQFTFEIAIP